MKEIYLSQLGKNKGMYVALVDDDDYAYINSFKWCIMKAGKTIYAKRSIRINGKKKGFLMHWAIMSKKGIDHIDHNGLNNQKSNLRICTQSENNMNRSKQENTSSPYKGVSFHKSHKKWRANIKINGKQIHIGYFNTEKDAAKAYDLKAIELFCEFANLNNLK